MASQYGTPGELPEQFYPEYIAPPAFDVVAKLNAPKRVDGPRFMNHAVAVWQVSHDRAPQEVIAAVSRSLIDAGWKVPEMEDGRDYL